VNRKQEIALWALIGIWIFQMLFPTLFSAYVRDFVRNRDLSEEANMAVWVRITSEERVHWEDHNHEMRVRDAWFDVLEIRKTDDHLYVKCIPDTSETEVIQALGGTAANAEADGRGEAAFNANAPMECIALPTALSVFYSPTDGRVLSEEQRDLSKGHTGTLDSPPDGLRCFITA